MVFGKHYSKYYLKYWFTFLVGALTLIIVDYAQLEIPDIVGNIVNNIQDGKLTSDILISYVKNLVFVAFIVFLGRFLWRICIFGNGVKIEADIRNEMFFHMEKMSTTYFANHKTGALMALFTNDLNTIRQSFGSGTLMLVDACALGVLAFYKMFMLNKQLLVICLIPLLFVGIFASIMRKRISKKVKKNLEAFSEMSDYTQEDFSGINVIKAFVKEKRREFLFLDYNQKNVDTGVSFIKDQALIQVIINTVLSIVTLLIIFIGGILVYQNVTNNVVDGINIGDLIKFNSYFGSIIWPVMAIGDLINLRGQSKASEQRVSALLDEEVEINDLLVTSCEQDVKACDIKGIIEYKNVTFHYPNYEQDVLKDVSFKINEGEMVGIMGGTGSGKSTIVELMLRLYNIDNNLITIDGHDIMSLPLKTVRDSVAYVPQETFLFKQSIDENIAFSFDKVDTLLTHEAAIQAGVSKDIEGFKEGYNTILGERGVTVSGGQKQRIAIARALIKDAPILILDDSLSAVDTITESYIKNKLKELRKGKTTIIIAHRITTLETLDKIIVVNDGQIEAIGNHEQLLKTSKTYIKEVQLQELEKELEGA